MYKLIVQQVLLPVFVFGLIGSFILVYLTHLSSSDKSPGYPFSFSISRKQSQSDFKRLGNATIWLKNGNSLKGRIKSMRNDRVILIWRGGYVTLSKSEIQAIEWG